MKSLLLSSTLLMLAACAQTQTTQLEPLFAASTSAKPEQSFTLAAVGDIRLNGTIWDVARRSGIEAPTAGVRRWLQGDIVFGNLECSITQRGTQAVKKWTFRALPQSLDIVQKAGFTALNLANNHVMDYGGVGLEDTLAALDKYGFAHMGAGMDLGKARKPIFLDVSGIRVGFLGLTSTIPEANWATSERPGVAYADFQYFHDWIREAKKKCDVLIVSFHGGTELAEEPNSTQVNFAHAAVDAGADLILGHHPHVIQPAEIYKGKIILYSLGNFLFVSPAPSTRFTVIARAKINRPGVASMEFIPVDTGYGRLAPASAEGKEAVRAALDRYNALTEHPELLSLKSSSSP